MRWDALFFDMELQLEAAERRDRVDEVAELTRAERAGIGLVDRLRGGHDGSVTLGLRDGTTVRGTLTGTGSGWVLVSDAGRERLVPITAVVTVAGLGSTVAPEPGRVARRLGLGHALRVIARDRTLVHVHVPGAVHQGRIDAVGSDHMDVAVVFADSGRPTGERLAIAFAGIDQVVSSSTAF